MAIQGEQGFGPFNTGRIDDLVRNQPGQRLIVLDPDDRHHVVFTSHDVDFGDAAVLQQGADRLMHFLVLDADQYKGCDHHCLLVVS